MVTTFETFDFDRYQRAPRLTFEGALALGAALLERRPSKAPAHVIRTAERLGSVVAEGREALTVRLRETGTPYTPDEMSLDMAADALWSTLRSRLEGWLVFEHPGFVPLVETTGRRSRTASSLALAQRNAARARTLLDRIFGPRGLTFAQASYPEQAEAMAALLRMIDEDELKDELDELVGEAWWTTLILVQEPTRRWSTRDSGGPRDSPAISPSCGRVSSG